MGGFALGKHAQARPHTRGYPAAKSTDFVAGDIVALSTVAALTTSSTPVVRPILAADIAALYQDGSGNVCGILGICKATESANASGIVAAQPAVSNVAAAARPIYPLPGYGAGLEADPDIGHSRIMVMVADDNTEFRARLNTGSATTALIGTLAGINLSSGTFTVNISATTKIFTITGIDTEDPTGNVVYVRVLPSFQQFSTAYSYTAQ